MKSGISKYFILYLIFCSGILSAQFYGSNTSVAFNVLYNTSSKLYPNTSAQSYFDKNEFVYLEGFMSYSVEIKRQLSDELFIGLSFERIKASQAGYNVDAYTREGVQRILVDDGFVAYPLELSLYYIIPISNEDFILYIGGGGGYYYGEQLRQIGSANIESEGTKFAWGIQVQTGFEYMLKDNIGIKGEMRFRDPEFEMTNSYMNRNINYRGENIQLLSDQFTSKVNIDGIAFSIGAVYHFGIF